MGKIWGIFPPIFPHIFPIFPPYFLWGNRCTGVLVYWCTGVLVYWCTGVLVYCFCTLLTYPPLQHNIFDVSLTHEDYMVVSPYKKVKPADVLVWAERRVTL